MSFNFDRLPDRRGTNSYKWDQSARLFGDSDILPLWVADMDFDCPPAVKAAIEQRAAQGVYGYTIKTDSYARAITEWFGKRHQWEIRPEWLTDVPGIVPALSVAVECFTEPGDAVILQSPVYYPFYDVIRMNGRHIAVNPLRLEQGRYTMDYEHLEQLMRDGAKLLLLCNPHNPGGRVWTREELLRLGELCLQYNVKVVSDEIHCDLVFAGSRHVPFASLSESIADLTLTCLAPSKTFNLPGLQAAFVVTSNPRLKQTFDYRIKALSLHMVGYFTPTAVEASYTEGGPWLDELLVYLQGNIDYALDFFAAHLPGLQPMRPDGTYLLWVDCRALGLDAAGLKRLMHEKAKVAFNEGSMFGKEGAGFLRINLACPRDIVVQALERFKQAIRS